MICISVFENSRMASFFFLVSAPIDGPFLFPFSVFVELVTFVFVCLSNGYPVGEELVVLLLVYFLIFFLL